MSYKYFHGCLTHRSSWNCPVFSAVATQESPSRLKEIIGPSLHDTHPRGCECVCVNVCVCVCCFNNTTHTSTLFAVFTAHSPAARPLSLSRHTAGISKNENCCLLWRGCCLHTSHREHLPRNAHVMYSNYSRIIIIHAYTSDPQQPRY